MAEIRISSKHRESVVRWLHESVEFNVKHSNHDERLSPYYVSSTAQIAEWKGQSGKWKVEQRGRWNYIVVECYDEKKLLEIALRWG